LKKAEAQPKIAEATASCQIRMLSVKKAAAISPWTKARTRSGGHHHELAWQSVGPDASDDEKEDSSAPLAAEHDPEIGRVPELENREGECDRDDRVADRGKGSAEEEQSERPLPKRLERGGQAPHARIISRR
jgi:hypothetical protein